MLNLLDHAWRLCGNICAICFCLTSNNIVPVLTTFFLFLDNILLVKYFISIMSLVGRTLVHRGVLIPRTCKYVTLPEKGGFVNVTEDTDIEMRCLRLSETAQHQPISP